MCLKGRGLSQDGTKREQRLPAGIFIMQEGNVGGVHITYEQIEFYGTSYLFDSHADFIII